MGQGSLASRHVVGSLCICADKARGEKATGGRRLRWVGWSHARGLRAGDVSDGRGGVDRVQKVRGERAGAGAHLASNLAARARKVEGTRLLPCGLKVYGVA